MIKLQIVPIITKSEPLKNIHLFIKLILKYLQVF